VLNAASGQARAIEFKRIAPNGRIQATTNQVITIATGNLLLVRVLSQESPGATFKITKELKTPSKKPPIFWIFKTGFIQDLPWDPGEWHWCTSPPLGDTPFFGYTAKRGYINARKPSHTSHMISFIQSLNLQNTSIPQAIARIWHSARPRKVSTLIWLTLNQGLPVGSWLQLMGLPPQCKVCSSGVEETPQHCLLDCTKAQIAWKAYEHIWVEWKTYRNLVPTWPFVLLGEAALEVEDDPPQTSRVPHRQFHLPSATPRHPSKLHSLPSLVEKM
jgi:hypothetical protein